MRAAEPNELKSHAYPVLAAAISEAELAKWFPVPFHHITDPQEAAEPSKAALIRLDAGDCFVLYYGELSNQLMLRIPTSTDASTFLNAFFREVPLPRPRVLWRRRMPTYRATLRRNRPHLLPLLYSHGRCQWRRTHGRVMPFAMLMLYKSDGR